jgi:hypothetical protein
MDRNIILSFPDLSLMSDTDFTYPNSRLYEAKLQCLFCHADGTSVITQSDLDFLRYFLKYPCTSCSLHLQNQLCDFANLPYSNTGSVSWIHGSHFVQLHFTSGPCPNGPSVTVREDSARIWASRASANYIRCLDSVVVPPCSSPQSVSTLTSPTLTIPMPSSQENVPASASSSLPPSSLNLSVSQVPNLIPIASVDDLKLSPPKVIPATYHQPSNSIPPSPLEAAAPATPSLSVDDLICSPTIMPPELSTSASAVAVTATLPADLATIQPNAYSPQRAVFSLLEDLNEYENTHFYEDVADPPLDDAVFSSPPTRISPVLGNYSPVDSLDFFRHVPFSNSAPRQPPLSPFQILLMDSQILPLSVL